MKWTVLCALLVALCSFPGIAHAIDCSNLPTQFTGNEFPRGNFFTNFANNPCYYVPFASGSGAGGQEGDLNSIYFKMFYKVDPRYQLIIVGTFPNGRYFAITAYDAHGAISESIADVNIVPLTSQFINPYQPATAFVDGQKYAVPIDFGGTPGTLERGCMMNGFNVDVNQLDGTQRHQGMDWNSDAGAFQAVPNLPVHIVDTPQHTNPNTAGVLLIRNYLDITAVSYQTSPHVIVRDVASGCAYPATYALNTLQVVTNTATTGNSWLDDTQANAHRVYENEYLPRLCFAADPQNMLNWQRKGQYVPGAMPDGTYASAPVPVGLPDALAASGRVMRLRFRLPTTPPTPCTDGCSRSGDEQMRYMSLSFVNPGGITLASFADSAFVQDPNGYVTLIVGTGAAIPSRITAANGYTLLDLTALSGYQQLQWLYLRNILSASTFDCASASIPYHTREHTPAGGLMGEYLPVVDYPSAAFLPQVATPLVQPDSCAVFPDGQAGKLPICGVFTPPPIGISSVVTQCPGPGCNQFVVQSQPPITITGGGFGDFPEGLPFTGTSNYLQITDTTQNWDAGYGTDSCSLAISSWASNRIQLVANVNQNGACPLAAGDQLTIKVWNPQTMAVATATVTVAAN